MKPWKVKVSYALQIFVQVVIFCNFAALILLDDTSYCLLSCGIIILAEAIATALLVKKPFTATALR